jgi:hypothetical protein
MARNVFFSFHYQRDIFRVNIVRNHAMTKGGYKTAGYWDRSLWEETKKEGDLAIQRMINQGLIGTSVTVVLVGRETANRRWVHYEIEKSIERGNGIIGIYIHSLQNINRTIDLPGQNPFERWNVNINGSLYPASTIYPTYDWAYDNGYHHFIHWVERAALNAGK